MASDVYAWKDQSLGWRFSIMSSILRCALNLAVGSVRNSTKVDYKVGYRLSVPVWVGSQINGPISSDLLPRRSSIVRKFLLETILWPKLAVSLGIIGVGTQTTYGFQFQGSIWLITVYPPGSLFYYLKFLRNLIKLTTSRILLFTELNLGECPKVAFVSCVPAQTPACTWALDQACAPRSFSISFLFS